VGKSKSHTKDFSRDDLITMVRLGEMSPAEAETRAERLGLEPLAPSPDPNGYDPMQEPFWTLPMAVVWIAYRMQDAVRSWWNEYRKECWDWHFREWRVGPDAPIHQGYFLEQRPNATLVRLQMGDAKRDQADLMSVAEAIDVLWLAFQDGSLKVTGIDEDTGRRVPIPAAHWYDLTWFEENGRDVIHADPRRGRNTARYCEVLVPAEAVRERWPFRSMPELALPELMKPEGAGYMPLYCAAQWIATQGGAVSFDLADENVWRPAYEQLLARIASEEIKVVGTRNGERQPVPGYHFAGCKVSYPFVEEPFELPSFAYLDEEHWLKGHDDSLQSRHGRQWGRLMVLKSDVARFWPLDEAAGVGYPLRSGTPGRPTAMHLVQAEFDARCARGEVAASLTAEAQDLLNWLRRAHPSAPPLTPKTIQNNLRAAFRQYKEARN
jgi:hypothetical protein